MSLITLFKKDAAEAGSHRPGDVGPAVPCIFLQLLFILYLTILAIFNILWGKLDKLNKNYLKKLFSKA